MTMAQRKNYKGKSYGRGKGRNFKETQKDDNREKVSKPTNDPSWYTKYPQLVTDTGSLFFSNPLGGYVPKLDPSNTTDTVNPGLFHAPGLLTVECIAVPGYSNTPNSPVNAVARGIYSFIRHANSGHSNYESPDLMMYLLAIDTGYTFWAQCVRAYGLARYFNVRSRYLAVQFLEAMGFDPENILQNLSQFRAEINNFAIKLSSYAVPASMDYFRRHTEMYTKIYLDEPSMKGQSYAFKLWKYYVYNNTTQDGGKLLLTDFPSAKMTLSEIRTVMSNIIDPIIGDEDMNVMSGDVLKAYTEAGIFKIPMITEDYQTPFVFDATVLSQIENSMAVPTLDSTSLGVTQDPTTSSIYFAPLVSSSDITTRMIPPKILNLHGDNPDPISIMEATRLMFSYELDTTGYHITNFGAELVASYTLWVLQNDGTLGKSTRHSVELHPLNDEWTYTAISNIASFNFHPRISLFLPIDANGYKMVMDLYALDNYTLLSDDTLANLSNTAMLSLYDVGRIALAQ